MDWKLTKYYFSVGLAVLKSPSRVTRCVCHICFCIAFPSLSNADCCGLARCW